MKRLLFIILIFSSDLANGQHGKLSLPEANKITPFND